MRNNTIDKAMLGAVSVLCWGFAAWAVLTSTGCSGLGVKMETYRIDEMQGSQSTTHRPLKCLFVDCLPDK